MNVWSNLADEVKELVTGVAMILASSLILLLACSLSYVATMAPWQISLPLVWIALLLSVLTAGLLGVGALFVDSAIKALRAAEEGGAE